MYAFRCKEQPIILPGMEGRLTRETGPFYPKHEQIDPSTGEVIKPSRYLQALINMVKAKTIESIEVDEDQVTWVGDGFKVPRVEHSSHIVTNGMIVKNKK